MRRDITEVTAAHGSSFDDLWAREHQAMVRLGTLLVGSTHLAEEIVQEAFAAVDARWAEIDRPGAYLRTVVVNRCRAALRRRKLDERVCADQASNGPEQLPTRLIELRDALHRLSDRQRAVIVLRYFVDLCDAEIASELGCRRSTVRSLARRALGILREELQ